MPRTFILSGLPSAQLLMRALAFFAQRDLLPASIAMTGGADRMGLTIVQDGLDDWQAGIILEKMRALPEVDTAALADT